MYDLIVMFVNWVVTTLKRIWHNDKVAFMTGIAMVLVNQIVNEEWYLDTIRRIENLIVAGYFVSLHFAAKRGEKIRLIESFMRARESVTTKKDEPEPEPEPVSIPETLDPAPAPPAPAPAPETGPVIPEPIKKLKPEKVIRFVGTFLSEEEKKQASFVDLADAERALKERIIGQDHAIETIVMTLKRITAGLKTKKDKPEGVILFTGPTGTGKTELVKQIAEILRRPLVRFDMPNYSTQAGVWELIGSPPGYVGSDKPGRLTGAISENPNAILLLDEIEKAHKDIWLPFLRVLDEGQMRDQSMGFTANFRNVLIFMTSNLLQFESGELPQDQLRAKIAETGYFRPEVLNRIDVIVQFKRFDKETMKMIAMQNIERYLDSFLTNNKLQWDVGINANVIDYIMEKIDTKYGVRDLHRVIETDIGNALADFYVQNHSSNMTIDISIQDGKVIITKGGE